MVIQYLNKAVAFMYIINSLNGGGIEKDRVSILISFAQMWACLR